MNAYAELIRSYQEAFTAAVESGMSPDDIAPRLNEAGEAILQAQDKARARNHDKAVFTIQAIAVEREGN